MNSWKTIFDDLTYMIFLLCCGMNLFRDGQYSFVLEKNPTYSWRRILWGTSPMRNLKLMLIPS